MPDDGAPPTRTLQTDPASIPLPDSPLSHLRRIKKMPVLNTIQTPAKPWSDEKTPSPRNLQGPETPTAQRKICSKKQPSPSHLLTPETPAARHKICSRKQRFPNHLQTPEAAHINYGPKTSPDRHFYTPKLSSGHSSRSSHTPETPGTPGTPESPNVPTPPTTRIIHRIRLPPGPPGITIPDYYDLPEPPTPEFIARLDSSYVLEELEVEVSPQLTPEEEAYEVWWARVKIASTLGILILIFLCGFAAFKAVCALMGCGESKS